MTITLTDEALDALLEAKRAEAYAQGQKDMKRALQAELEAIAGQHATIEAYDYGVRWALTYARSLLAPYPRDADADQ